MEDSFTQRKTSVLGKIDKSSKGSFDAQIEELCDALNVTIDYYTTSSCSGKSVIMVEKDGKDGTYYLWTSHNLISLEEIKSAIDEREVENGLVKFKCESPILHVGCRTLGFAQKLVDDAKRVGWKRSGIMTTGDRYLVELCSVEKMEFPIAKDGKLLVSDEFLEVLVDENNSRREKGWKKIEALTKTL